MSKSHEEARDRSLSTSGVDSMRLTQGGSSAAGPPKSFGLFLGLRIMSMESGSIPRLKSSQFDALPPDKSALRGVGCAQHVGGRVAVA
eukprot:scaffold19425_cov129-Isochrysis_galbana.AAC.2